MKIEDVEDVIGGGGKFGVLRAEHGGVQFHALYDLQKPHTKQWAERDLRSYVEGFYFAGCGGPFHDFDSPEPGPEVEATCLKCGVVKLRGQRLDKEWGHRAERAAGRGTPEALQDFIRTGK